MDFIQIDLETILNKEECSFETTNEFFDGKEFPCKILIIGSVGSNTFLNCYFPNLIDICIRNPKPSTFIHCHFPKLTNVLPENGLEEGLIFHECTGEYFDKIVDDNFEEFQNKKTESLIIKEEEIQAVTAAEEPTTKKFLFVVGTLIAGIGLIKFLKS